MLSRPSGLKLFTRLVFLLISHFFMQQARAQVDPLFFEKNITVNPADSNQFCFRFHSTSFLRNNEYVNPIYKGYTLIGFNAEPRLEWQTVSTTISGGVFYLAFDGTGKPALIHPVFTVTQRLSSHGLLLFGTLNAAAGHHLPHPVYSMERNLIQRPEQGLQLFLSGENFNFETWVNWEKFLRWGENTQEELSGGISAELKSVEEKRMHFRMPLYLLAQHRGGQIDVSPRPIQTLMNMGVTPEIDLILEHSLIKTLGIKSGFHRFSDASPQKQLAVKKGYAFFPALYARNEHWALETGLWKGYDFYAKKGDPLFQSIAFTDSTLWPHRNMVTLGLQWHSHTDHGVRMSFQAEAYYDLKFREMDYSYSFYLIFSDRWLIRRKKIIV